MYVKMKKDKTKQNKTVNVLKMYKKTQYLTLIQTNRIARMGMNVTISLANDYHVTMPNSDQKKQKMYPCPHLHKLI